MSKLFRFVRTGMKASSCYRRGFWKQEDVHECSASEDDGEENEAAVDYLSASDSD